ncbi:hypothetical protein B9Z55_010450 [Caenorhabditis nigoni]|uniref:Uncharacterized protein n=1 Tax=Caenorhabditis nigoni TaxID=1611254 RepID=A0A2G5UFW6_9PELO|nr:hypothetical protein B9Z55_010450 [Caenorhabditis nigoni]
MKKFSGYLNFPFYNNRKRSSNEWEAILIKDTNKMRVLSKIFPHTMIGAGEINEKSDRGVDEESELKGASRAAGKARDLINSTKNTGLSTSKLDDDHRDRQRMDKEDFGCWKELNAAHCQEASDALLIAISFV